MQQNLLNRTLAFRREHTREINTQEEFTAYFTPQNPNKPEIHGGFALTHWNGSPEIEARIKEELKVTIRCIPDARDSDFEAIPGICPFTGEPSTRRVLFGKAY
jgi:prolyl-tRNA synthetase